MELLLLMACGRSGQQHLCLVALAFDSLEPRF